jgi:TRAP-type C4-dicarboxylate transport system substrate-binding protein
MRHPRWVRILVAVLACGLIGAPASLDRGAAIVKLATLAPDGTVWHKGLMEMGQEWSRASGGEVALRVYGGGVAGDESALVRKMRIGQLDAATLTVVGLTEIDDSFQVLGIPLFFRSYEELDHVLEKLEPALKKKLEDKGFVFLNWAYAGWVHFFSTEPVRGVEDLKKLKIFASAGENRMVQLYKENGFRPVALSQTDILVGLETGMIEVLPTPPLAALLLQWFRSTPYMLDEGLGPLVGCVVMTRRGWNKIPADQQAKIRRSADRLEARLRHEIPVQDRDSVSAMVERGLQVTSLDPKKEADWREVARSFSETVRGTLVPPEIFDRALKARDSFQPSASSGESD